MKVITLVNRPGLSPIGKECYIPDVLAKQYIEAGLVKECKEKNVKSDDEIVVTLDE